MEELALLQTMENIQFATYLELGQKIKVDNMTVEPIAVDHSIPAAYGFIIHTSEGTIAYTGDLRRHGPRKDLTENFIQKAKDAHIDALICEGTRMALKKNDRTSLSSK